MAILDFKINGSRKSWPLLLTPEQAAALLQVSRKTIYEKKAQGKLPGVVDFGGFWRVDRDALFRLSREDIKLSKSQLHSTAR